MTFLPCFSKGNQLSSWQHVWGPYHAETQYFDQTDEDTEAYVPQSNTIIPPIYHNNSLTL